MTPQLVHIGEIAALLLAFYAIGWVIGYVLHRAAPPRSRLAQQGRAAERPISPAASEAATLAISESTPVSVNAATPVEIAATIPEPAISVAEPAGGDPIVASAPISALDTLKSLATVMPLPGAPQPSGSAPAPAASDVVPGPLVSPGEAAADIGTETSTPTTTATPLEPEVRPAPSAAASSGPQAEALPATAPGIAWSGTLGGHEAERFACPPLASSAVPVLEPTTAIPSDGLVAPAEDGNTRVEQPEPALSVAELDAIASGLVPVDAGAGLDDVGLKHDEFPSEPAALPTAAEAVPPAFPAAPGPAPLEAVDEDAAMRDIEGGWSRRASHSPTAELTDISAAVNAAQFAVEQVLARSGVDADTSESWTQTAFGKPRGLPRPRDGGRDDLKQIVGLGPMDESALNNLGIYHFDQIANLDEREVLWLENHAFARGRIGRENWQQQARQLGAETASLRVGR